MAQWMSQPSFRVRALCGTPQPPSPESVKSAFNFDEDFSSDDNEFNDVFEDDFSDDDSAANVVVEKCRICSSKSDVKDGVCGYHTRVMEWIAQVKQLMASSTFKRVPKTRMSRRKRSQQQRLDVTSVPCKLNIVHESRPRIPRSPRLRACCYKL